MDDDMERFRKTYLKKVDERISGAKVNLLALAAPLESGGASSTSSKPKATVAPDVKPADADVPNQKLGLVVGLLALGALRPALSILTKFPWLMDAHSEIADLMIRILNVSIAPLYNSTFPKERKGGFMQPRPRYGAGGSNRPSPRRPQLTLWAPTPPSTNTTDFVFFLPEWASRVPLCTTSEDLVDVLEPLLRFIGLHVSRDPLWITKFVRLGRIHLASTVNISSIYKQYIAFDTRLLFRRSLLTQ
jgi:THO complex subunit 2